MSKLDDLKVTFFQETEELLEELTDGLERLAAGDADDETVNAVFRAVHSIKGGAGAFALDEVVRFAHRFETSLDALRSGTLTVGDPETDLFLRCSDHLSGLIEAARDGRAGDASATDALLGDLCALSGEDTDAPDEAPVEFTPMAVDLGDFSAPIAAEARYKIRFRPYKSLFARGNEPAALLREVSALGQAEVRCDDAALPAFDDLDPEGAYFAWTIDLTTGASDAVVHDAFEFVEGLCDLSVEREDPDPGPGPGSGLSQGDGPHAPTELPPLPPLDTLPPLPIPDRAAAPDAQEGGDAEACAAMPTASVDGGPSPRAEPSGASATPPAACAPDEETAPESAAPSGGATGSALAPAGDGRVTQEAKSPSVAATIRVELPRIDRMINLVGELVINQAMLSQSVKAAGGPIDDNLELGLEELRTLTRQIQDSVMAIRAQPIKPLFQRMSRIAREASSDTGKPLRFDTDGVETEIDKTVIERLADPLTHMIRNAIDHGVEKPEARRAAGKPEAGHVRLTAAHQSGRVVIELSDDGAGINRQKVRAKAIDKGLVSPEAQLSPAEVDNLIFLPGFSTAETLSNLSGRGVGMDVVRQAIQALGGKVSIASEPGRGSTFTIVLPLTLAVLDGIVIDIAGETMVVPVGAVMETLLVRPEQIQRLTRGRSVARIGDRYVPIVDVANALGLRTSPPPRAANVILLVEATDGAQAALLIDAIHDQRQVVMKGLTQNYGAIPGIAAATILGDGRIALILDPASLVASLTPSGLLGEPPLAEAG